MPCCLARAENVLEKLGVEWSPNDPRTPVLAVGSNAGPEQLLRKYPPVLFRDGVMIPCVRCILADFDVAYSPCITSYGSCSGAATVQIPTLVLNISAWDLYADGKFAIVVYVLA